jgi:serine/threonine protein kinase
VTLAPATRLGPYEIITPLGAGGMGEVYRARDTRLGRDVAIKVLPDAVAGDPERLARFEREARTVAGLNHPNIVVLHSIEEGSGVRFITMELVEGERLDRHILPRGLPLSRVLEFSIPLTEALVAAHEKGVVHRDLKPANVMVTREGG